jgi:uncharacterized protein (TIGR01777 family)
MRVLVTGGSGLIGRALCAELARTGYETWAVSRRPNRVAGLPEGVRVVGWDGRSPEGWLELAEGALAIVHLAGENIAAGRWTARMKERIRGSRLDSSAAVAQAIDRARDKPRVMLQASAVGYYGPREDEQVTEDAPPGDDFLARLSKAWEASTVTVEELGVRRAVLRTGVVLSTEGGALAKMLPAFRLFAGGPVGNGRQYLPWIHIADEVGAIRFFLETEEARGPFNLTAPNPVTNREFARALGQALGRPASLPAPASALRLLLGEMADLLLTGQRAVPSRLLEQGYEFRFPGIGAALRDLLE